MFFEAMYAASNTSVERPVEFKVLLNILKHFLDTATFELNAESPTFTHT